MLGGEIVGLPCRDRGKVLKHIKNTYLKQVNAPIGVNPILKAWMELNEG